MIPAIRLVLVMLSVFLPIMDRMGVKRTFSPIPRVNSVYFSFQSFMLQMMGEPWPWGWGIWVETEMSRRSLTK